VSVWRKLAWLMLVGATGLLCLVPLIGHSVNGNQNWIQVGGITIQPSEMAKFALLVWAATVLAAKRQLLGSVSHVLVPVVPVAVLLLLLVLVGHDLGTALVFLGIMFGVLFVAGAPMRVFGFVGVAAVGAVTLLVKTSENRMNRITSWLGGGEQSDYLAWLAVRARGLRVGDRRLVGSARASKEKCCGT
jgi:cell division protein FtsW